MRPAKLIAPIFFILFFLFLSGCALVDQVERSLEIEKTSEDMDDISETFTGQEDSETIVVAEDIEQEIKQNHRAF